MTTSLCCFDDRSELPLENVLRLILVIQDDTPIVCASNFYHGIYSFTNIIIRKSWIFMSKLFTATLIITMPEVTSFGGCYGSREESSRATHQYPIGRKKTRICVETTGNEPIMGVAIAEWAWTNYRTRNRAVLSHTGLWDMEVFLVQLDKSSSFSVPL